MMDTAPLKPSSQSDISYSYNDDVEEESGFRLLARRSMRNARRGCDYDEDEGMIDAYGPPGPAAVSGQYTGFDENGRPGVPPGARLFGAAVRSIRRRQTSGSRKDLSRERNSLTGGYEELGNNVCGDLEDSDEEDPFSPGRDHPTWGLHNHNQQEEAQNLGHAIETVTVAAAGVAVQGGKEIASRWERWRRRRQEAKRRQRPPGYCEPPPLSGNPLGEYGLAKVYDEDEFDNDGGGHDLAVVDRQREEIFRLKDRVAELERELENFRQSDEGSMSRAGSGESDDSEAAEHKDDEEDEGGHSSLIDLNSVEKGGDLNGDRATAESIDYSSMIDMGSEDGGIQAPAAAVESPLLIDFNSTPEHAPSDEIIDMSSAEADLLNLDTLATEHTRGQAPGGSNSAHGSESVALVALDSSTLLPLFDQPKPDGTGGIGTALVDLVHNGDSEAVMVSPDSAVDQPPNDCDQDQMLLDLKPCSDECNGGGESDDAYGGNGNSTGGEDRCKSDNLLQPSNAEETCGNDVRGEISERPLAMMTGDEVAVSNEVFDVSNILHKEEIAGAQSRAIKPLPESSSSHEDDAYTVPYHARDTGKDNVNMRAAASASTTKQGVACERKVVDDTAEYEQRVAQHNLTPDQISRYSRHLLLDDGFGVKGQIKLLSSSALVIGAGGIGSTVLLYLASSGVGKIGIVDFDNVEMSNLHRQVIHSERTLGVNKAVSAARTIAAVNPTVNVVHIEEKLDHRNALHLVSTYDVIVDASDNPRTRYLINDACVLAGKPLVSGSAIGTQGQITVYNHRDGPCYRCLYPKTSPMEGCKSCSDNGVLGTVPGLIGVLQATEVIKVLTALGCTLHDKMLMYDSLNCTFLTIKKPPPRKACAVCGHDATIRSMQNSMDSLTEVRGPLDEETGENSFLAPVISQALEISCSRYDVEVRKGNVEHILLDVRVRRQYDVCALDGSINIPLENLELEMDTLEKLCAGGRKAVYCICRRGVASAVATEMIATAIKDGSYPGIPSVQNISGGLVAWAREVDEAFPIY